MKKLTQKLYAGLAAAMLATPAHANNDLKGFTTDLTTQMQSIPVFFSTGCYVIGIAFVIAGLFKLREYVDDPSSGEMKNALIRLGVGGLLILLPFAVDVATGTVGKEDTSVSLQDSSWDM